MIKELIEEFNTYRNVELYSKILDLCGYNNRQKCKDCGGDIMYSNVKFAYKRCVTPHIISGTSHLTTKNIFEVEYTLNVCECCLLKRFPELCNKNMSRIFNMPNAYVAYAFDVPDDIIERKKRELCVRSLDNFISKYGVEEGTLRWNEYVYKCSYTYTYEYKNNKYGMTMDEFNAYNKSRAVTYDNMIRKYGYEDGCRRYNDYRFKEAYTNSLHYYIQKYGESGIEKLEDYNKRKRSHSASKISQDIFDELMRNDMFKNDDVYYDRRNYEYEVVDDKNKCVYYLDFYDKDKILCIEFNGNAFHPKKDLYNSSDLFKPPFGVARLCKDIWEYEDKRLYYLKTCMGMQVFIIWGTIIKLIKMNILINL